MRCLRLAELDSAVKASLCCAHLLIADAKEANADSGNKSEKSVILRNLVGLLRGSDVVN